MALPLYLKVESYEILFLKYLLFNLMTNIFKRKVISMKVNLDIDKELKLCIQPI